jgi:hypothetical protein
MAVFVVMAVGVIMVVLFMFHPVRIPSMLDDCGDTPDHNAVPNAATPTNILRPTLLETGRNASQTAVAPAPPAYRSAAGPRHHRTIPQIDPAKWLRVPFCDARRNAAPETGAFKAANPPFAILRTSRQVHASRISCEILGEQQIQQHAAATLQSFQVFSKIFRPKK